MLRLPTSISDPKSPLQIRDRTDIPYPNSPFFAKEGMVFTSVIISGSNTLDVTFQSEPAIPGPSTASQSSHAKLSGMVSETEILKFKGLSNRVIKTLLQSRKPVTRAIYLKVWRKFNLWLTENGKREYDSPIILEFLQEDIDKNLSLSTVKV